MPKKSNKKSLLRKRLVPKRNDAFFDTWSVIHLFTGVMLGWIMAPFAALVIMVLWEPLEILVLSPLLARFGVTFGFESLKNSLSDIFFDAVGVVLGAFALGALAAPPFHLF